MDGKFVTGGLDGIITASLFEIRGQPQVTDPLKVFLSAHVNLRATGSAPTLGPILLSGPPGLGKTLVARGIHEASGNRRLVETNGEALNSKLELFSTLIDADDKTTIFIDEAQGLSKRAQNILLTALSEGIIRVTTRSACSRNIRLARFTIIFATTHEYMLSEPLRNRIKICCRFNYYSVEDLIEIVSRKAEALRWHYESDEVLRIISQRAKGTPRQALNRNLQTCWYVAGSHGRAVIMLADVHEAFDLLQIDELGLEQLDRSYLAILHEFGGASLGMLSSKLSLPTLTLQRVVEPYLMKEGFVTKGRSSARVLTEKGIKHVRSTSFPLE